ncbi:MAG: sigma 54-interacting transcriptional regulator [Acidobacteria bacterium]|nr:sigma 54-interacting transcriptional regulator [Acidobacteriota bacterium]
MASPVSAPATPLDARYRALAEVAGVLASQVALDDLLRNLRGLIETLIPFEFLAVYLRDEGADTVSLRLKEARRPATLPPPMPFPLATSYPGRATHTGEPVYVAHVAADGPAPSARLVAHGIASYCAVPLSTPRGTLGAFAVGSKTAGAYSADDVDFLARVGRLVAVAVENAQNLDTVRRQQAAIAGERDRLNLLLDVTNAVVRELDIKALFRAVAPALRRACGADAASLSIFDPDTRRLRVHACDLPSEIADGMPSVIELSLEGSPAGLVFRSGAPRIFSLPELNDLPDCERMRRKGIRAFCAIPLVTAQGTLGALSLGAFDPDTFSEAQLPLLQQVTGQIAIAVGNALSYKRIEVLNAQLAQERVYLQDEIRSEQLFEEIVGRSAALRRVLQEIETVAPTDSTVLILGETGSGKELMARAIHQLSARRDQAFVKLNCAAIPTGLLESELFGHERGAFTGAIAQRIGRFELAHQGTVFLDEIGEVPLDLQPKLLRVIQEREFERLGSARTLRTDARLIAATNRDLAALVDDQRFRQDLFYRLNVFPIQVPPLRDRREDIPTLVRHFTQQFSRRMKKTIETIPAETMEALTRYEWPGNIRELQNLIERAVILSRGPVLDVPLVAVGAPRRTSRTPAVDPGAATTGTDTTLAEAERRHIVSVLRETDWVVSGSNGAAARLGMKRSTLQFRMRKLGIERPRRGA